MGCLDTWVLERAPPRHDCQPDDPDADCQILDPDQPHRWYLPPKGENTQGAGSGWDDRMASPHPSEAEVHKMRYKIPLGLNCTHCTLQWYWSTGNTCLYDGGYFSYFSKMAAARWSASSWCSACMSGSDCSGTCCGPDSGKYAEEFWNCADIRVLAAGQQLPTLPPSPQTAPTPSGALPPSPPSAPYAIGSAAADDRARQLYSGMGKVRRRFVDRIDMLCSRSLLQGRIYMVPPVRSWQSSHGRPGHDRSDIVSPRDDPSSGAHCHSNRCTELLRCALQPVTAGYMHLGIFRRVALQKKLHCEGWARNSLRVEFMRLLSRW